MIAKCFDILIIICEQIKHARQFEISYIFIPLRLYLVLVYLITKFKFQFVLLIFVDFVYDLNLVEVEQNSPLHHFLWHVARMDIVNCAQHIIFFDWYIQHVHKWLVKWYLLI